VLLREIVEQGYTGGLSRLRAFMRSLRVVRPDDPVVRLETLPGPQMQCDWAVFRRDKQPLSAFVATLGFSRASDMELVTDEKLQTLLDRHEHAFDFFGSVAREVLYDNMKAVALERDAYGPRRAPFSTGLSGLRQPPWFPAAALTSVSRQDQGQGRALQRVFAPELLQPAGLPVRPGSFGARCRHR
jgi:transposase